MKESVMKFGMLACCVVMFFPIVIYFVAGGTLSGITGNLAVFAPLLLCVGAHVLMFKVMGKSCHDSSKDAGNKPIVERPTDIPSVGTTAHAVSDR